MFVYWRCSLIHFNWNETNKCWWNQFRSFVTWRNYVSSIRILDCCVKRALKCLCRALYADIEGISTGYWEYPVPVVTYASSHLRHFVLPVATLNVNNEFMLLISMEVGNIYFGVDDINCRPVSGICNGDHQHWQACIYTWLISAPSLAVFRAFRITWSADCTGHPICSGSLATLYVLHLSDMICELVELWQQVG